MSEFELFMFVSGGIFLSVLLLGVFVKSKVRDPFWHAIVLGAWYLILINSTSIVTKRLWPQELPIIPEVRFFHILYLVGLPGIVFFLIPQMFGKFSGIRKEEGAGAIYMEMAYFLVNLFVLSLWTLVMECLIHLLFLG